MQELIPISETEFGGELKQTVDARELYLFLELQQEFANWIKNRIDDYGFVENQDFLITLSKTPGGGRPRIDYHITLDMAKEMAMVERNERGKEARQYFIACERQLKTGQPLVIQVQAVKVLRSELEAAALLGVPLHLAQVEAVKQTRLLTHIDYSHYLLIAPAQDAIADGEMMLEPTPLGALFGISGVKMNRLLANWGLQRRLGERWEPTDEGRPHCSRHQWVKGAKSDYNWKWAVKHIKARMEGGEVDHGREL